MSASPTVLCAISHGLYQPWISILHEGQEKTWLRDERPEGVEVIHFHGSPLSNFGIKLDKLHEQIRWSTRFKANTLKFADYLLTFPFMGYQARYTSSKILKVEDPAIHIHFPDSYLTYRWKELALFRYFLTETKFDYLFLTSSSSYVKLDKLKEYVENLPAVGVYAGATPYDSAEFISGANRILSRDVIEQVVKNSKKFNPVIIEDVALGNLISRLGFLRTSFPISNIGSLQELEDSSADFLEDSYHFRLKSGSLENRKDVEIMHKLHSRIGEAAKQ
jgi:hypothetical protein